ncbi:MAG: hypothetical protein AAF790_03075 [Planctomycetota bacterium]
MSSADRKTDAARDAPAGGADGEAPQPRPEDLPVLDKVAGHLNFSEGAADARFLANVSVLYASIEGRCNTQGESRHDTRGENRHDGTREAPGSGANACPGADAAAVLTGWITTRLAELHAQGGAFKSIDQAQSVSRLITEHFRPAYRKFHRDLMWHRSPGELWRPFFYARVAEAVLAQGPPWDEPERIVPAARDQLDDYIGYRPVAVLETEQKIEPYRNEWVRPIPLYVQGAGVAHGPYAELIELTLAILNQTDPVLLREAWFDPELIEELAVDPRAYDFDHPAGKRPNHHFGQWDPDRIDGRGYYRRFVLQPLALDALMSRVREAAAGGGDGDGGATRQELLFEAAAVLAGTMLMASGTSGDGPGRHSSEVTLSTLLPHIAAYRDEFYTRLLERAEGAHGQRLRAEATRMRQPFAAARQHLNQELARRRASQMQRVQLAQLFARMGYPQAALRQAQAVRVASARMLSQVYCQLTDGHRALDRRDLVHLSRHLPEIEDLLHRGIECGALVDPWNVVGFGGNFSLFPALENTVHDYRVDDLIQLVEQVLDLCSRAWTEAAAVDDAEFEREFSTTLGRLSDWWDQYATAAVGGVRRLVAKEIEVSTNLVAGALNAWHKAGAAAGDVGFWRMFVDQFDTPKAFQLVIEALLDQEDLVASMALMMQWVSQADLSPLEDGDASFYPLAERWLRMVEARERGEAHPAAPSPSPSPAEQPGAGADQWPVVAKFFAHLEASADEAWHAPVFELDENGVRKPGARRGYTLDEDLPFGEMDDDELDDEIDGGPDDGPDDGFEEDFDSGFDSDGDGAYSDGYDEDGYGGDDEEDEDELDNLFSAAYEDVTFRDSSDDGMDSAIFEPGGDDETAYELEEEAERIGQRLALLTTVARLWKRTAITWGGLQPGDQRAADADRQETLDAWSREAASRYTQLGRLLEAVHQHRIPAPRGGHESMVEYDRRRTTKDSLLEQIIATCVEVSDAGRLLRAAAARREVGGGESSAPASSIARTIELLRATLAGDADGVRAHWAPFCQALAAEPLLYIPLGKGGDPRAIVKSRALHQLIHDLAGWLPRLGLVREACQLLDVAQRMETDHPVGSGAVTEYDALFENGYTAIVRCLVASAETWDTAGPPAATREEGGADEQGGSPAAGSHDTGPTETGPTETGLIETGDARQSDSLLVQALQDLTQSQLDRWLRHSGTVRLSVVERLAPDQKTGSTHKWDRFVKFVERYGGDLFTQRFLSLGNLRAILHQRVGVWLEQLREDDHAEELRLLDELGGALPPADAAAMLGIAIESVVENYREYRDYNSTTTQSDRGELLYTFVDFVRLRAEYDRIAWRLKPVFLAHKILVRQDRPAAAEMWRRIVADRTTDQADQFQRRFHEMCQQYGMRLPTIAERLAERFVRPLTIDRLRALVPPAMLAVSEGGATPADESNPVMAVVEEELEALMQEPCGAGLDVPDWIQALEEEVSQVRQRRRGLPAEDDPLSRVPQARLSWAALQEQLQAP